MIPFQKQFLGLLIPGLFLATGARGGSQDLAQAKSYLKSHIRELDRQYPFNQWQDQLKDCRKSLDKLQRINSKRKPNAIDNGFYKRLIKVQAELQSLKSASAGINTLMHELSAQVISQRITELFQKNGQSMDGDTRFAFKQTLYPLEEGSLRPKRDFLAAMDQLQRNFSEIQTNWLFDFSQAFLIRHVQAQLDNFRFAKNEALFDDFSLQLAYWAKENHYNPQQAYQELLALTQKLLDQKGGIHRNLENLLEYLDTDMLFSDLLAYAHKENVEFNIAAEEKIEASLKTRSTRQLMPIQQRIEGWRQLETALQMNLDQARVLMEGRRHQALAKEEEERREQERQAAMQAEKKRLEAERKENFKSLLTSLSNLPVKGEDKVELGNETRKALAQKSGVLKSSYVGSGQTKLKVDKRKFSDTLALVEKFSVAAGHLDFSKLSLSQKEAQSAYTYSSPEGRTSQQDLDKFVREIALGSFSTYFNFFSYMTPAKWAPGRSISWKQDKGEAKQVQDREFSYVDLVVDAHRKRSNSTSSRQSVKSVNLPANMLIILDPRGSVIRYQQFADINKVRIYHTDLVEGKLHYKFLNYSVDRANIYLNGIDLETKVSIPGSKS